MPVAWYIVPFERNLTPTFDVFTQRQPVLHSHLADILPSGGGWNSMECNGGRAIAKVRARQAGLDVLNLLYFRLPRTNLRNLLSDLTDQENTALTNELLARGFSSGDITARFGANLRGATQLEVLAFMATRYTLPSWNGLVFVYDGDVVTVSERVAQESIAYLDAGVVNG